MRTLIDIPEDDIAALDDFARRKGLSRAAVVRDAVRMFLTRRDGADWIARGRGYWQHRGELVAEMRQPLPDESAPGEEADV
jgi:metal-responsive CopG/Arc/MetJ family transcriptional regulator